LAGPEKEVKRKARMRSTKKREPPSKASQLSSDVKFRKVLLVDHLLDNVSNDRQLEFLVRVSFVHQEYPNRKDSQTENREDGHSKEADDWNMEEDKPDNPQSKPNWDDAYVESDGLGAMKFYERTLVNKQKDEAGDPSKNIAKQSGDVFIDSCGGGIRSGSRSGDRRALRSALRGPALGAKRCIARILTTRSAKCHEGTSWRAQLSAEGSKSRFLEQWLLATQWELNNGCRGGSRLSGLLLDR
jgi:hypothetical protein